VETEHKAAKLTDNGAKYEEDSENVSRLAAAEVVETLYPGTIFHPSVRRIQLVGRWTRVSCKNKEIVHIRIRPRCATHDKYLLDFIVEQNLVGIERGFLLVFYSNHSSSIRYFWRKEDETDPRTAIKS